MWRDAPLFRFWRAPVIGLVVLAALSGCARQALEQRAETHRQSAEAWDTFFDTLQPYDDPDLAAYVEGVLARVAGPKAIRPAIQVMDSAYPHAYVSRRTGIRITRGMLATLQNEAELAFVIGHELSHLHQSPTPDFRRLDLKSEQDPAGALARAAEQRMGREVAADLRAAFLLKEAGYDGSAARAVLAGFEREAESDSDAYDMLFRTHPSSARRIALLPPGEKGDVNAERFLKAIEGLPFSLPGAGLRRTGDRIAAPALALSLPAPDGFELTERAGMGEGETLVFSRRRDKMVFTVSVYIAEPREARSALEGPIYRIYSRAVFKDFGGDVSLQGLRDVQTRDIAAGVAGASGVARLSNTDPSAEIWLATYALRERWLTATFLYPTHKRSEARALIETFESGIEPIAAGRRPRIRLERYEQGDRLERLAAGFGEGAEALERFRRLNGLPKGGRPKPGQLLKTIAVE